ncbi:MAG: hypothetical protein WCJ66_14200 [Verrucomicrobiota bacterium]
MCDSDGEAEDLFEETFGFNFEVRDFLPDIGEVAERLVGVEFYVMVGGIMISHVQVNAEDLNPSASV